MKKYYYSRQYNHFNACGDLSTGVANIYFKTKEYTPSMLRDFCDELMAYSREFETELNKHKIRPANKFFISETEITFVFENEESAEAFCAELDGAISVNEMLNICGLSDKITVNEHFCVTDIRPLKRVDWLNHVVTFKYQKNDDSVCL